MSFSRKKKKKRNKKKINLQAMAPSKMSASIKEEYAQCEIIFCDEKLQIRPYSQVK